MDPVLMQKAADGSWTAEERTNNALAIQDHVFAVNREVDKFVAAGAFDVSSLFTLLTTLLPSLLTLIPGIGPVLALVPGVVNFVNQLITLFGGKPLPVPPIPLPGPAPAPVPAPSPFVIPTPSP